MIQGRRIFITGGGGFIGTSIAERLVDDNQIILYDLNFENNAYQFSRLVGHPNVRLIEGDILDLTKLKEVVQQADIVIHLAAIVGVKQVLQRSRKTIEVNFIGTSNLLHAVEDNSIERFVFLSTSEVFGSNAYKVGDDANSTFGPTDEARWSYAISKIAGEHLVQCYHRDCDLPTVIIRPFNIFGPKRIGDHVIIRFIYWAIHNQPLIVHGDGESIRSWCYIDDFCDALMTCLEKDEAVGQTFNIGNSHNTLTLYELAKRVIQLCGSQSKIVFREIDYSDVHVRVPNTLKARRLLDFNPKVEIDDAILLTKKWYEENFHKIDISYITT